MGWTWDYVWDTLTVERLEALEREWGEEPMTHRLLADFMGVEKAAPAPQGPAPGQPSSRRGPDAVEVLSQMFPGGGIGL